MHSLDVEAAWNRLTCATSTGAFDPADVAGLPPPARRYLLNAIRPGTALAGHVRLRMHGHMRLRPAGSSLAMRAEQLISVPHGFVWKARVGPWWSRVVGHDAFEAGVAEMRWKLWNVVPVVDAGGTDVARSAAGRLAIESIFLPSALLPSRGASWEAVDDSTARVTLPISDEEHAIDLTVDDAGRLLEARMMRWGNSNPAGRYALEPFGTFSIDGERSFGGWRVPTRVSVGWRPGSDAAFEFFFAQIDDAVFG